MRLHVQDNNIGTNHPGHYQNADQTVAKCIYLGAELAVVEDVKNADGAMDMTLRTPIPPALTGRLACLHCSSEL